MSAPFEQTRPDDPTTGSVDVRLSPRVAVRLMGVLLVLAAGLVIVAVLLAALLSLPRPVLTAAVLVIVVLLVAGVVVLGRRASVVRLSPEGYRVRFVRGAGVSRGRWADVDDAVTAQVAGARCLVLRRRDGGTTTIPVDMLEGSPEDFVGLVRGYLTRGRGLRPL